MSTKSVSLYKISVYRKLANLLLITVVSSQLSACETLSDPDNGVSIKGTMPLERVKLGMSEGTLKDATNSFAKDLAATANAGGKSQYLSREKTPAGGQYVVQCKDGSVYGIQIVYSAPVNREAAQILSRSLLPQDAPPQSRVDDQNMKTPSASEGYFFGDDYLVELSYEPSRSRVTQIKAYNLPLFKKSLEDAAAEKNKRQALLHANISPGQNSHPDKPN